MARSVDSYSRLPTFTVISDVEVTGTDGERLQGVFGLRMRMVRMRLVTGEMMVRDPEGYAVRLLAH